jgi:hypothetical protein
MPSHKLIRLVFPHWRFAPLSPKEGVRSRLAKQSSRSLNKLTGSGNGLSHFKNFVRGGPN